MKRFNRIPEFSSSSGLAKVEKIVIFSYRLSFHKIDKRPEQDKKKNRGRGMKLSSSHTHAFRMILVGELLDINKVLLPQSIRV